MSEHEREDTGVVEILARELTHHEESVVTASGFDLDKPLTIASLVKVMGHVDNVGARRASADDFTRMKARVNIMWALLVAALLAAGGSTVAVVSWLKDGAKDELIKTQLLQHDADQEVRLRALENRLLVDTQRLDDLERARWRMPTLDRAPAPGPSSTP